MLVCAWMKGKRCEIVSRNADMDTGRVPDMEMRREKYIEKSVRCKLVRNHTDNTNDQIVSCIQMM